MIWMSKVCFVLLSYHDREAGSIRLSITDREWVDLVNKDRQAQQLDRLSYELFEVVMDQLEKEWFALVSSTA
jgi:hypothetical protein